MQQEEAQYKFNHIEDEAEFVVWRENTLDLTTWSGKAHEAAKSRAKELLSEEMKSIQSEIDEIFPIVLPPPPPRSQE
ncbi:hypothetical protein TRFO_08347 [Tritrichomonas foetus]|uniref:Uncharacterized protein n=1 Tax=Tritrichomonas foetus TaxID=1144522 RepID=A0A1J4JKP0_9EUKA|nr:hypothetical protein TRFO_08347 [Tritrichomonas foetus]|eukprot:OHS99696.1 hypothetical protein TRFO_08347 [Tritrichomonas foetus]